MALPVTIQREIDTIVYRLFDLTPAEIALIETALAPVRGQAAAPDDTEQASGPRKSKSGDKGHQKA